MYDISAMSDMALYSARRGLLAQIVGEQEVGWGEGYEHWSHIREEQFPLFAGIQWHLDRFTLGAASKMQSLLLDFVDLPEAFTFTLMFDVGLDVE